MKRFLILIFVITTIFTYCLQNVRAQQKTEHGYNYGSVCVFVTTLRTFLIPKPQNVLPQGSRLIAVYGGKGDIRKAYNFSKEGLEIEFITINGVINVKSISLSGESIPGYWRSKENIVSLFEITTPPSGNKIDIGCDASSLIINYTNDRVHQIVASVPYVE